MKRRSLLRFVSVLMLLTALPLAVWIWQVAGPSHFITEAEPEAPQVMPHMTAEQGRREGGRLLGAGLALLTIPAGAAGLAEQKREKRPVCTCLALAVTAGELLCLGLMGGVFFLTMPVLLLETGLYWIGLREQR